jgi:Na+/H+ antiporter NhaC
MLTETIPGAIVIVPPLLVLTCAIITRRVLASLVLGIVAASAIFCSYSPIAMAGHIGETLYAILSSPSKIYLFSFLAAMGTLIELMTHSGGITAYTKFLRRFIKTERTAQATSVVLSNTLFLDDYLNGLVTGSIMRPLTDSFKIPRIKLAYLLNSMCSPLGILVPATTWTALILGLFQTAGITEISGPGQVFAADQFITFLSVIPFIFYPIFTIFSVWLIILKPISFGLMRKHEQIAQKTGNLFGGATPPTGFETIETHGGSMAHFILPMGTFLITLVLAILFLGNSVLLGGANGFIATLNADPNLILKSLLCASLFSLGALNALLWREGRFSVTNLFHAALKGLMLMKNSILVLTLAFTLGEILEQLRTGVYIALLIKASLPLFLLPLLVFALATITTASTGSSWGALSILMPVTLSTLASLATGMPPFALFAVPAFFPTLGGLLAGSVAGAHISPITDATVVAAMSARANHLEHVRSQISYSIPAIIGACIALLISGLTYTWHPGLTLVCALSAGIAITAAGLLWRNQEA